jgi:hypothetical protein
MFIHLGGDTILRVSEVIAIIDLSSDKKSKAYQDFIHHAKANHQLNFIEHEDAKSLVVTEKQNYMSPISSTTLKKRANIIQHLDYAADAR